MKEGLKFPNLREHLKEGVKPIMVCVGTPEDFREEQNFIEEFKNNKSNPAKNIGYLDPVSKLNEEGYLNSGRKTYVLSTLDSYNKFSENFKNCIGLIVTGVDKETGESISFLSHQDPVRFLRDKKVDFIVHLNQRLEEIKARCVPGTIDAVIIGGNYIFKVIEEHIVVDGIRVVDADHTGNSLKKTYLKSTKLLSEKVKQVLGFTPRIENGPKIIKGNDYIYFDNENGRLYLIRPKVNQDTGSFTQADIEEEKKKWEQKESSFGA